jgi:signal recognition particle GTPase
MSFEVLQSEVRALPADARRKLMAFMVALQNEGREGYAAKLAQKIDDQSPERWLSAEDCERKLGLAGESQ